MKKCHSANADSGITYRKEFLSREGRGWVPYRRVRGCSESQRRMTQNEKLDVVLAIPLETGIFRCKRKDWIPSRMVRNGAESQRGMTEDTLGRKRKLLIQLIIKDHSKHIHEYFNNDKS